MLELLGRPFQTTGGRIATGVVAAILVVFGVVIFSGGGDDQTDDSAVEAVAEEPTPEATAVPEPTATPAPTATPEPTPTPAPTATPVPVSPLNGTEVDGPTLDRLLTVKIDNHANAQPQTGIQHADMLIEIQVEGITRFLSVWQYNDAEVLGPIRSMRPTDFAIQNQWESTFINSGGQGWVQAIGRASNVNFYAEPRGSFRVGFRRAPHNLYGDTTVFRELDDRGPYDGPLEPLWNFGELPADAAEATAITTNWKSGYQVNWAWNGEAYERSTHSSPHNYIDDDGNPQRITADTLVMMEMVNQLKSGGSGSAVPSSETTGSGAAWVFADGRMQQGTWARETQADWFTLTAEDGSTMTVPPGRLWLILALPGGVVPA
jgi:hypothetical protein